MLKLPADDPLAIAVVSAIRSGDIEKLQTMLNENADLATARIVNDCGVGRTLLHVVTDWPGHFPNGARTVAALISAGADVNATVPHPDYPKVAETPLHWAASSDDVAVLDALLDGGADIDAPGAVIGGGPPLADATAFAQWKAAHRLVERGAKTTLWDVATLGLMDRLENYFGAGTPPESEWISYAFWGACHGGQRQSAEYLLARGADMNWIPRWERKTPLDAGRRSGSEEIVEWLRGLGAKSAEELPE